MHFSPSSSTLSSLILALALVFAAVSNVQAQTFSLPGLPEQITDDSASPEELSESLDVAIKALEDDKSREALVKQLKSIQQGLKTESDESGKKAPVGEGLLDALAVFFDRLTHTDGNNGVSVSQWKQLFQNAQGAAKRLVTGASLHTIVEITVGLAIGLAILLGLTRLARATFNRRGWPLEMPRHAKPWMLIVHFLRQVLPWLLAFAALFLGLGMLSISGSAKSALLIVSYIGLCGRALTSLFDVLISAFSSGHRKVAVAILRQRVLVPLFIIGALFALVDALGSVKMTSQLGPELGSALSMMLSITAALLSFFLILRNRRPVTHLIRNRSYRHRKDQGVSREVVVLLAKLWHVPVLLAISVSVVAVFIRGGAAEAALGKVLICALLLIVVLAIQGLVGIHSSSQRRKSQSNFSKRLVLFGYRLTQIFIWLTFFELILQVSGLSLLGLGGESPISKGLTGSLTTLIITALAANLAWIFGDELLERALRGGDGKKKMKTARAQTIGPIARNTLLTLIIIITILVSLSNFGVDVTPLLAGAGIIGLAVGFGAQTLVQDLITGLFIVVEDSMSVGDFVEINGFMGTVEGFNLRTVRMRDLEAVVHHITFSKISSIHNMSRQFGIALIKIRIPRELPIDDAIQLMTETAEELRKQPAMRWLIWSPLEMQGIHAFEDGCPVLRMRMRTKPEYQWEVSRAFNLLLKRRMEDRYLDVAAPRISVHMEAEGGVRSLARGSSPE